MTIWCNSCRCHVSAPCASHHHQHDAAEDPRSSFCRRFRSTKGASKARRDHINHEIRNMRALLPVGQEDQERLSYLHAMAAICAYIRKSVLFQGLPAEVTSHPLPYEDFLQALHGFVLVVSAQGRLVYVSENVSEYLGLSMIDVLQGDTFYEMVERSDVDVVKSNLDTENNSSAERSFTCCMQTSKAFRLQRGGCCSMLVRGSFQSAPRSWPSASSSSSSSSSSSVSPANQPLFVALCTPTVDRLPSSDFHLCQSFDSVHGLDMTFTRLSDSVLYYLGYSAEEMAGRSWYGLVHPEDLSLSADSHRSLMGADEGFQVEMVLRLQCKDLSWTWVYVRANKDSECQSVSCTNFIISEREARFLQKTISSDAFRPSSQQSSSNARCFKRSRTSDSQSEEPGAKARRESEQDAYYAASSSSQGDSSPAPSGGSPALFTPPYSPASSSSPLQQEELSRDLLMDVHGYSDRLLSSPECSPSCYCYPEAGLSCHHSPAGSFLDAAAFAFEQAAFGSRSPLSSSSPAYDFPACTADARLVPDSLSASDVCDSPVDCALHQDDFGLLERPQGGSLGQMHHVPQRASPTHSSLLTPGQSPTSTESYSPYSERERAEISILAQQISSLASSFATYHHHANHPLQNGASNACDWPRHPPPPSALPLKCELVLDDGVFDSILKDLDMVPRKPPITAEQFTVMDPFGLQQGRREQNTELHQLNRYMQSGPQRGGLAEENLY